MRFVVVLAALLAAILPPVSLAQTPPETPSETWTYKETWASPNPTWTAAVYGDTAEATCRASSNSGSPYIFYKGIYYIGQQPDTSPAATPGTRVECISLCPSGTCTEVLNPPAIKAYWPARLVCLKVNQQTNETVRIGYGHCPCEAGCSPGSTGPGGDGSTVVIGNPVELPSMTKVAHERDWTAPNEPRFAIERSYRSDSLLVREFTDSPTSERNTLGGVWRFSFDDWFSGSMDNPYDAADTRDFWKLTRGNGGSVHFLMSDRSVKLGTASGYFYKSHTPTQSYIDDGRGLVRQFSRYAGSPNPLASMTWPDGYKITFTRTGSLNLRLSRMADNRGNIADFTYDLNVVAGADRLLVKEITLSRVAGGVEIPFGKIIYSYEAVSYTGPDGSTSMPSRPFITAVDYLDLGTSVTTPIRRYGFVTGATNNELAWPPLLTSISDGTEDGSGDPISFAEYDYEYAGFSRRALRTDFSISETRHAGDAVVTVYSAAPADNRFTVENPKGLETTYDFDHEGLTLQLTSVDVDATASVLGTALTQSFDTNGFVAERIERNGSKTSFARNARGLITTMTEDADGAIPRVTSYTWHATLRLPLTRVTPGLSETFTYDAGGLLLTYSQTDTKAGSPSNGQVRTWTYGYTTLASGLKVLTTVNGPGLPAEGVTDITTYAYAATGELNSVTDPNGLVTTVISRNGFAQPTEVESPDKTRWTFDYDWKGRVISAGFAGPGLTPASSTFAYNLSDQIVSLTNSRGKTWTFTYNAARRLIGSTSPEGDTATFIYDEAGNVGRTEYSNGGPATFWEETEFDGLSRILKSIGAMGQEWDYAHDEEDNLTSETDPLSNASTHSYDALNRLVSTLDRESFTTGMDYDAQDRLTEYTDPRAIETVFTYNGFGEVILETSADRGSIAYSYDRRGLVTSRTDARGVTVNYSYDNGGRLTLIDYPAGGIGDIAFTWDLPYLGVAADANKGHMGRIDDGTIRMDFGHEVTATGPRITMTALYPAGRSYTVVEETDFEGNATRTAYPSGREVLVDYDDDNRPTRIRVKDGAVYTNILDQMTYAPNGPMASALYGDGYTQTRTYDLSYRLTGIEDALGATQLRDVTYGYEGRDNISAITDTLVPANSETFGYTPRESLASASGPYGALGFSYDGVGNRLTHSFPGGTDAYVYPVASNRLVMINLATGGSRDFTYDAAGNVTAEARAGGTYGYTYNAAGRMSEFRINGILQAQYKYDAMGRQAIRTISSPTAVTIHSVFDSEGRRIAEYDETSGALIREYVWNGWDPVAVIEGGAVYFVRADHIGRPVFATNASGVKVWSAIYLPFGGVHVSIGALPANRFPGQWFQAESGLHQNWMRDYDPTTGRYLQADPLGLVDGASVYGYVRQNPILDADPTGKQIAGVIRPGTRFGPSVRPIGPRGWFDLPPIIVPRETLPEKFVDHPKAKEEYRKYKAFCNSPPPDTGDRCTDLLNRAEYLFRCAKMKDDWDNEWLPGRHKSDIATMREAAKRYLSDFYRTCASCSVDELPMSRPGDVAL